MNLYLHDITERRERDGRMVLWLSERLLVDELSISSDYLWKKARPQYTQSLTPAKRNKPIPPDTGKSWRYAKMNGQFYYDYDRLPDNRKALLAGKDLLIQQYNSALQNDQRAALKRKIEVVLKSDFRAYLHHYRGCKWHHCEQLAKACAVLTLIAKEVAAVEGSGKCQLLKDFANVMNDCGVAYVPRHWRRLGDKVDKLMANVPVEQVVKLPRRGNKNSLKYDDPEIKSWLLQMRSLPANYTNAFIIRKLRTMCQLAEKKAPSKSWFESKLAEPLTKFLTFQRFGSGKLGDRYKGYIPIQNALHAGDCWQMDGTKVNFIGWNEAYESNGKTKYAERSLYKVVVYDVHSGKILGVSFADSTRREDRWMYIDALKMAVAKTGYLPYELVLDRFPGHNTEEVQILIQRLELLGVTVDITSKKTGKAKIERQFLTMQSVFYAESPWYYGEGVQSSRPHAHRSPEYIDRQKKKRSGGEWGFDSAWREAIKCIEKYNRTNYSEYSSKYKGIEQSPADMHNASDKPHTRKAEIWETVQLFGLEKSVTIRNGGLIRTEIQKVEYFYRVEEYETLANHTKVRLCYDMEDLGEVYLFEDSNEATREYLGTATEQRRAQLYGPNADMSEIGKAEAANKEIEKMRKEHFKTLVTTTDEEGFESDGSEVNILLGGLGDKADKANAETIWLEDRVGAWKDTKGKPRLITTDDDDDDDLTDVVPDARSQY